MFWVALIALTLIVGFVLMFSRDERRDRAAKLARIRRRLAEKEGVMALEDDESDV